MEKLFIMDFAFITSFISLFTIERVRDFVKKYKVSEGRSKTALWLYSLNDRRVNIQTDGKSLLAYYKPEGKKAIGAVKKYKNAPCWIEPGKETYHAFFESMFRKFSERPDAKKRFLMAKFFIINIVPATKILLQYNIITEKELSKDLLDLINESNKSNSIPTAEEIAADTTVDGEDVIEYINKNFANVTNSMTIAHAIRKHEHMEGDYQAVMSYCLKLAHKIINDRRATTYTAEEEAAATVVPEEESINSNIVDSSVYENVIDTNDEVSVTDEESAIKIFTKMAKEKGEDFNSIIFSWHGSIYASIGGTEKPIHKGIYGKELEEVCIPVLKSLEKKKQKVLFLHRYNVCEEFKDSKYITCIRI